MPETAWQTEETARAFVEGRRAMIPLGDEQMRMLLHLVGHFRPEPRTILDLGCGDGILARTLMYAYPESRAVLVDHSEPMLERARKEMESFGERSRIVSADMGNSLLEHVAGGSMDVVVSGYAIHHLPDERKRSLYGEIFEVLAPGGLFVNLEHVASVTRRGEALFDELYVANIAEHSGKPLEEVHASYHGRADKRDNILTLVETQLQWLREIGFAEVDCYFKWLELAVLGGVRSG